MFIQFLKKLVHNDPDYHSTFVLHCVPAADVPLVITPSKLVVEYGAKASANCSTTNTHNGMGWEASQGAINMKKDVSFLTWTVERLTTWDIRPICFINMNDQKMKSLSVTIYSKLLFFPQLYLFSIVAFQITLL